MNNLLPKARTVDVIVQEADKELLIYDLRIDKAYTLNETSRNVYKACNGKNTFDELKNLYQYTDDLIHLALDDLTANNLIDDSKTAYFAGMNRRDVIKKVGLGTMVALPMIVGLVAPKAIQAQSQACFNVGGAAAGQTVSVSIQNPTNNTTTNQNAAGQALNAQCCNNAYRNFISNGCSSGQGQTCNAQAVCL